ncbi:hypothetical protein B0H14DRAFT_3145681 [Mycena olivaceomarginata]|nr:hypothetical protein B0H14DRAFT_3145681 [Mycena olivaceomarginata]
MDLGHTHDADNPETSKKQLFVSENEAKWVGIQPFLLSVGYRLRSQLDALLVVLNERQTKDAIDAIRIEDGKKVCKRVQIYLSHFRANPRNRTIPVLQTISFALFLPNDLRLNVLVVMPYGRRFVEPPCVPLPCRICGCDVSVSGGPCILSRSQYLPPRLITDDSRVVPLGSHFCLPKPTPETQERSNGKTASPSAVRYFYIDFGPSMRFPKGRDTASGPYNPFKVNIFQLGLTMANVIKVCFRPHSVWIVQPRSEFHHEYDALRAFFPVANRMMTRPGPAPRTGSITGGIQPHRRPHFSEEIASTNLVRNHRALTYFARNVASVFRKDYSPTRRYEGFGSTTCKEIFLRRFTCGLPDDRFAYYTYFCN